MNSVLPQNFSTLQRVKLLALAIAVEAFYLFIAFIPASVIALLSAAFYGPSAGYAVGIFLLLGVAWIIRPDPTDLHDGIKLQTGSELHGVISALSVEIGAPAIHDIVLTDEPNASAFVSNGFFSVLGVRRQLRIGVPLLRLLSSEELRAVIAHELGHFSRNHSRIGQWIYRVQYKWSTFLLVKRRDSDSFIESSQKLIAHRFVPYFLKQSSAWSHHCEYEADASAQAVGLSQELITALTKLEIYAYLRQSKIRHELTQWQLGNELPPEDVLDKIFALVQQTSGASYEPAIANANLRSLRLYDTHPRLQERARALQIQIALPTPDSTCAGLDYFPAEWNSMFADHQRRWTATQSDSWRFAHYSLNWLKAQAANTQNAPVSQAIAAAHLSTSSDSLALLRSAVKNEPNNAYLQYELGRCLLDIQDEAGLSHLQEAIKTNKKMAMAALQLIANYHADRSSVELISRSFNRLEAANRWANHFCDEHLWARLCTEPLEPLPETSRNLFTKAVRSDKRVDGCWVGSLQSKVIGDQQFKIHLIVFRMDGSNIHDPNHSEEQVRSQIANILRVVTKPDELIRVKSVFFSEPMNPNLLNNLQRNAGVCIVEPQQLFNQKIIKIDSL